MTKLFNTTVIPKGSEYWLRYWTEEKPDINGISYNRKYSEPFREAILRWEHSFKEVRIHPDCVKQFEILAWNTAVTDDRKEFLLNVKAGDEFPIPPDNVEIIKMEHGYLNPDRIEFVNYAFLNNAVEKEEKPDQINSVTNCPTCGSRVKVEGKETHYYVPVSSPPQSSKVQEETQKDEYIKELEAAVCFLAGCYEKCKETYFDKHLKTCSRANVDRRDLTDHEASEINRFPLIQGTSNQFAIKELAKGNKMPLKSITCLKEQICKSK